MIDAVRIAPESGDIFEFEIIGKLYSSEANELERRFKEAASSGARHLIVHCGRLQQLDSTVLRAVIAGIRVLHEKSAGKVVFADVSEHIRRLMTVTGLAQYCLLAATRGEALSLLEVSEDTTDSAMQ